MKLCRISMFALLVVSWPIAGCQQAADKPKAEKTADKVAKETPATSKPAAESEGEAEIKAARAELSPEDRKLVDAQDYCPVMPEHRLGGMGAPFKLMIKDQPVFLCCKACKNKALKDPDKTLAKVEELKTKRKGTGPEK